MPKSRLFSGGAYAIGPASIPNVELSVVSDGRIA